MGVGLKSKDINNQTVQTSEVNNHIYDPSFSSSSDICNATIYNRISADGNTSSSNFAPAKFTPIPTTKEREGEKEKEAEIARISTLEGKEQKGQGYPAPLLPLKSFFSSIQSEFRNNTMESRPSSPSNPLPPPQQINININEPVNNVAQLGQMNSKDVFVTPDTTKSHQKVFNQEKYSFHRHNFKRRRRDRSAGIIGGQCPCSNYECSSSSESDSENDHELQHRMNQI